MAEKLLEPQIMSRLRKTDFCLSEAKDVQDGSGCLLIRNISVTVILRKRKMMNLLKVEMAFLTFACLFCSPARPGV